MSYMDSFTHRITLLSCHWHCGPCRRKWWLTDTDLCPCGETQTMSHIVKSCPLTKLNGALSRLHSADEDAVSWLTSYGLWNAYEKKKKIILSVWNFLYNCSLWWHSGWHEGAMSDMHLDWLLFDYQWHLLFLSYMGWHMLSLHASAEACLRGWPNVQPRGRD